MKKKTPEAMSAMSTGKYVKSPEHRQHLRESTRQAWAAGRMVKHEKSIAAAKANAAKFWTDEGRAKNLAGRASERFQSTHKMRAKMWHLRSPSNVAYHFKNLREFVRTNPGVFPPETVRKRKDGNCSAVVGISRLRPESRAKVTIGSWHGWTWISATEVFYNDGDDLLEREQKKGRRRKRENPVK